MSLVYKLSLPLTTLMCSLSPCHEILLCTPFKYALPKTGAAYKARSKLSAFPQLLSLTLFTLRVLKSCNSPLHQAMRFGNLPVWAEALSGTIHKSVIEFAGSLDIDTPDSETPLAPPLLWRDPLFDQMIVNSYQPGEVSMYLPQKARTEFERL